MRHHALHTTAILTIPLLAGLLTACAGQQGSPGVTAPSGAADRQAALVKYAQCMRGQGLADFPDPVGNGFEIKAEQGSDLSADSPRFKAAQSACKNLMPAPRGSVAERRADMLKISICMRAHGVPNFPDPGADGGIKLEGGTKDGKPWGVDRDSPQFKEAQRTCEAAARTATP
jgi:hypothetical protein